MIWGEVSISDAAELLTNAGDPIGRPALSRYCDRNADAIVKRMRGKERVVDFENLAKHRRDYLSDSSPAYDIWQKVLPEKPGAAKRKAGALWAVGKEIFLDFDALKERIDADKAALAAEGAGRG